MLEVIDKGRCSDEHPAPLLFVHGGNLAAWCWDEHFLDFFADKGFRAVAVSLRGHGASLNRPSARPLQSRWWCRSGRRGRGFKSRHPDSRLSRCRARGQHIGRPEALDKSKSALAQRMHASGESANVMAAMLGACRATVYRVLADQDRERRTQRQ